MMNGQDDVISAESKAIMLRPASAASPSYGFGWSIDTKNGRCLPFGPHPRGRDARCPVAVETERRCHPRQCKQWHWIWRNRGTLQWRQGESPRPRRPRRREQLGPKVLVPDVCASARDIRDRHRWGVASPGRTSRQVRRIWRFQPVVSARHDARAGLDSPSISSRTSSAFG